MRNAAMIAALNLIECPEHRILTRLSRPAGAAAVMLRRPAGLRRPMDMTAVLTRSRAPWWIACGAALAAIYLAVFAVVGSTMFARAPGVIGLAATFDLTVTATAA